MGWARGTGQQFTPELLEVLFDEADLMASVKPGTPESRVLDGYIMASLFYEPSTRTRLSFEAAMCRLGGSVITTENAGETLEDSIRTVELYSDVIVLRHFASGSAGAAAAALGERDGDGPHTPLINAGDGPGQHPSQALLDVYTIRKELGRLDNLTVGLVGDLANGRTVRSLVYLLGKYTNIKFYFVAPDVVRMKDDIKEYLDEVGMEWEEADDLMAVASQCDVLYQTRIQKERFGDRVEDYESARGKYIIDNEVMAVLPQEACVMHPLPRVDEIAPEVDADPRAAYFRQAQNGLFIRMALLKLLLLS
eukprot:PRCOL_00003403-RA